MGDESVPHQPEGLGQISHRRQFYHPMIDIRKEEKDATNKKRTSSLPSFFSLSLHRKKGSVVQLYRMSDSGSEDRGLESRRGHKKGETIFVVVSPCILIPRLHDSRQQGLFKRP